MIRSQKLLLATVLFFWRINDPPWIIEKVPCTAIPVDNIRFKIVVWRLQYKDSNNSSSAIDRPTDDRWFNRQGDGDGADTVFLHELGSDNNPASPLWVQENSHKNCLWNLDPKSIRCRGPAEPSRYAMRCYASYSAVFSEARKQRPHGRALHHAAANSLERGLR